MLHIEPKCYDELGCFKRFPPSQALHLPDFAGLYPAEPEEIDVKFYLYTCQSPYRPYIMSWNVTDKMVNESPYIPKYRTIFIVHGFRDLYQEMNWMGVSKPVGRVSCKLADYDCSKTWSHEHECNIPRHRANDIALHQCM